jgi:hypothetical protein
MRSTQSDLALMLPADSECETSSGTSPSETSVLPLPGVEVFELEDEGDVPLGLVDPWLVDPVPTFRMPSFAVLGPECHTPS